MGGSEVVANHERSPRNAHGAAVGFLPPEISSAQTPSSMARMALLHFQLAQPLTQSILNPRHIRARSYTCLPTPRVISETSSLSATAGVEKPPSSTPC